MHQNTEAKCLYVNTYYNNYDRKADSEENRDLESSSTSFSSLGLRFDAH